MAKSKAKWRRVLTGRFLRWWFACKLVRLFPALGIRLGFFPDSIGLIEGADRVLADEHERIEAESFAEDQAFLDRCRQYDSAEKSVELRKGLDVGRRTALYDDAWIDMATGSILLPKRGRTVLVRGEVANWNATSLRFSRQRVSVSGRAMPLLNTTNYFHQLLENGLRVIDLLESGLVDDAPLTLLKVEGRGRVENALYDGIARLYPDVTVRHLNDSAIAMPDQVVCHFPRDPYWEWPRMNRPTVDRLTAAFEAVYGSLEPEETDKLYLTRRDVKMRAPVNTEALEAHLIDRGFHALTARDTNHPEQIARFRAARTVVAVHGAGLTNLLFCRPGTRVIEIFPENFVKSPYWWICRQLGLEHCPVYGGPGDYAQKFQVDIGAVDAALDGLAES